MYKEIYVPVDNSDFSNRAVECGLALGKAFSSKLTGCHVYAAAMHDYRFKQMEYTLPEEYLDEVELERQRKIHDSLITMGLKLISDSYLDGMSKRCRAEGLEFVSRMMDGKHHTEILKDIQGSGYDLVVLGALGLGRSKDSVLGSVAERVARHSDKDVWLVKRVPAEAEPERDTILVGIDGSPQSFGALMTALDLGQRFGKKVEAIAVYDPYLHYSVFNGIVSVLTEQAAKVFRFEEQNQLHEEIIDTGLAQIYQSHLDVASRMATDAGFTITKTLLDGKAFQKILDRVRKTDPWLLVLGRIGVHSPREEAGLGSNTENLLRACPCDVLLTTRLETPRIDIKAEESIRWTPEAEQRMTRVPAQVRGVARTGILRLAFEKGHSVVTNSVIDEAMERFMPKKAADMTTALAEAVALERARTQSASMCRGCGVTATQADPVRCSVCGASDFEVISPEMLAKIAEVEGGLAEETTYDGRKLAWTEEAKKALWTMKDAYQRRRVKARVEKGARMKKLPSITLDFAKRVIEDETGVPLDIQAPAPGAAMKTAAATVTAGTTSPSNGNGNGHANGDANVSSEAGHGAAGRAAIEAGANGDRTGAGMVGADGPRLIARDDKKNPLVSIYDWTPDAIARAFRVPAGFMRNKTQERIEAVAAERGVATIDLPIVEAGIELGRAMMAEMIATYPSSGSKTASGSQTTTAGASPAPPAGGNGAPIASSDAAKDPAPSPGASEAGGATDPAPAQAAPQPAPPARSAPYLNEVTPVSAFVARSSAKTRD